MTNEIQFQVRRVCKHNRTAPHTVIITNLSTSGTAEEGWCTDGDTRTLSIESLTGKVNDILSVVNPRLEREIAEIKADQIVLGLQEVLR